MPFKTKSGTHYHMTEGCCGAIISCDTAGLEPCSICCGGTGGTTGGGTATGTGTGTGSGGTGSFEHVESPDPIGEQDPVAARQRTLASALQAGMATTDVGIDLGPVSGFSGTVDARGLAALSMMDDMDLLAPSFAPPIPPMPPAQEAQDPGIRIDANGEIVRDATAAESRGQRIARTVAAKHAHLDHASPDYAGKARTELIGNIEEEVSEMPDAEQRERTRRDAQEAWNEMHPDAPVLVWSRNDDNYVSDSSATVLVRRRNYSEMRDSNHGSNEIGYDYRILDKATGADVTDDLHQRDVDMRRIDRRIADIEEDAQGRAQREVIAQRNGLYQEWLEGKRRESSLFKYHGGSMSWDSRIRDELWEEFVQDTGYVAPEPQRRFTAEEQASLGELYERRRVAMRRLDEALVRYDVDESTIRIIRPQYQQGRR